MANIQVNKAEEPKIIAKIETKKGIVIIQTILIRTKQYGFIYITR